MFACAHDERRGVAAEPREDWRDNDEVYCALAELEERFVGDDAALRVLFDRWLSAVYWRRSLAAVAASARCRRTGLPVSERVVRRQVETVSRALRTLYGEQVGSPVEVLLGFPPV